MSSINASNLYYNWDNNCGFEKIAELDYSDGSYCFDLRVVWREISTGRLLTGRSAGCSCPCPFEEYTTETLDSVNEDCIKMLEGEVQNPGYENHTSFQERIEFIDKVKRALRDYRIKENNPGPDDNEMAAF